MPTSTPFFLDTIFTHHLLFSSSISPPFTSFVASALQNLSTQHHRRRHLNSLTISIQGTHSSSILPIKSTTSDASDLPLSPPLFYNLDEITKRRVVLENFTYTHEDDRGSLGIRLMSSNEVDETCLLIADSIPESSTLSKWNFNKNITELEFLVKQYLDNQRIVFPHSATLIGFYRRKNNDQEEEEEEEERVVCTIEISFNALGMHSSPPTPLPPRDHPYISNMVVKRELRRKGIGWHLLKACEELMSLMSNIGDPRQQAPTVYLHCKVGNRGALNMYKKAGYRVVKTDNILVWLSFHRRKTLMFKKLFDVDVSNQS